MKNDGHKTGGAPLHAKKTSATGSAKNACAKSGRATKMHAKTARAERDRSAPPRKKPTIVWRPHHFTGASLKERLRSRVVPDPETGCHVWSSTLSTGGYGRVLVSGHRLAYELANGPIPEGLLVLHKCDNPACCNPDHLFLGTAGDNMADKSRKGRHRNGYTGKLPRPAVRRWSLTERARRRQEPHGDDGGGGAE